MPHKKSVVIVGAGLAGLTAALRLVQSGHRVTGLEKRSLPGGRTSSWMEGDMRVESGLHKVLGIYRAMPQLLRDVGVALDDIVTWVDAIEIHSPRDNPNSGYFTLAPLHRPFATLHTALTSPFITWSERVRLLRMLLHGLYDCMYYPEKLDEVDSAVYARRYGTTDASIHKIFQPLTQGVFFLPTEEYSAYGTFAPILAGLRNGGTFRVGAFRGGMSDVLIRPIVHAIEHAGGTILPDIAVTALRVYKDRVVGVITEHETYDADHVVIATPIVTAQQLLRKHFFDQLWVQQFLRLRTVSTISVQFDLVSPVFHRDHTHFSNAGLVCFAEQSHTTFPESLGRLSGIVYPADELLSRTDDEIVKYVVDVTSSLGLTLSSIRQTAVVRHPHEFYAITEGAEALRPSGPTPVPGLTLAGDYIKQPFLASMEGAIISGNHAAETVSAEG